MRPCGMCGEMFEPARENGVYCSFRCQQEANRRRARERSRRLREAELAHRRAVLGR